MPKAIKNFLGYSIYFYSNEGNEPIHVHVSKGGPSDNSTKFWIKRDEIVMENNNNSIPKNDLKKIVKYLNANRDRIVGSWYSYFGM